MTQFVDQHVVAWEVGMAGLAVLYLVLAIEDDGSPGSVPLAVLLVLSGLFLLEFLARWCDAASRWRYLRAHWLDLISCIPLVGGLRILRLFRLVRLVRMAAGVRVVATTEDVDRPAGGRLWFLLPTIVVVWVCAALTIWTLEHGVNPHIRTFGDALYWAFITGTTVGYGDTAPATIGGRILAGVLVFFSIGLIGVTSSRLTALWLGEKDGRADSMVVEQLSALRAEVASLSTRLVNAGVIADEDVASGAPLPPERAPNAQPVSVDSAGGVLKPGASVD